MVYDGLSLLRNVQSKLIPQMTLIYYRVKTNNYYLDWPPFRGLILMTELSSYDENYYILCMTSVYHNFN